MSASVASGACTRSPRSREPPGVAAVGLDVEPVLVRVRLWAGALVRRFDGAAQPAEMLDEILAATPIALRRRLRQLRPARVLLAARRGPVALERALMLERQRDRAEV